MSIAVAASARTHCSDENPVGGRDARTAKTASAQTGTTQTCQADTVMLSKYTDGDYTVCRMLVHDGTPHSSQHDVMYAIGKSDVVRNMKDNAAELNDIASYVDAHPADSLCHVQSIIIIGYASPDGPETFNRTLAAARARNFATYLVKNYPDSKRYKTTVDSRPLAWTACRSAVASSAVPMRNEVLAVIDGNIPDAEKERRLKRMPEAWNYLAANILPAMRRVDVTMNYDRDRVVTSRTLNARRPDAVFIEVIERDQVDECAQDNQCCCEPVETQYDGIIVELFGNPDE